MMLKYVYLMCLLMCRLSQVLINEDEIVSEELRSRPPKYPLGGDIAFSRHRQVWEYFAPDPTEQKKKK